MNPAAGLHLENKARNRPGVVVVWPSLPATFAPMFTSSAETFRRRQAVSDLISVVRAHSGATSRLGVTETERRSILAIVSAGCVMTSPKQDRFASQLLLTAALPDDDFTGFITATAILVVNRLSGGRGDDDLYWNWDAFQDHYRLAEPAVRAAIMNGFRTMDALGLVTLDHGPTRDDCLSMDKPEVLAGLARADPFALSPVITGDGSANKAGRLWQRAARSNLPAPTLAGFRHLYERPRSMEPDLAALAPLLPWGPRRHAMDNPGGSA